MDPLHPLAYPALLAGGVAAGAINTLAGGGSFLTLPLMIFLGVPAPVANGTNRIGVIVQNISAVASFRKLGVGTAGLGTALLLPACLGTVIGAQLAVEIDEETFERVLGGIMVVMAIVMARDTSAWLRPPDTERRTAGWKLKLAFFLLGIYGGFLQAGIGVFLMAALVWGAQLDLLRANAVKVAVVLVYTVVAFAIFAWNDQIAWTVGLVLAVGQAAGGAIGARLAVDKGVRWVRGVVIAAVLGAALVLLEIPQRVAALAGW